MKLRRIDAAQPHLGVGRDARPHPHPRLERIAVDDAHYVGGIDQPRFESCRTQIGRRRLSALYRFYRRRNGGRSSRRQRGPGRGPGRNAQHEHPRRNDKHPAMGRPREASKGRVMGHGEPTLNDCRRSRINQ
jgi:hypothetical protein